MTYQTVKAEKRGRTLLLTLNKPEALNVTNGQMGAELIDVTRTADEVSDISCVVITESLKAFAAGADIREMPARSHGQMYAADWFEQ